MTFADFDQNGFVDFLITSGIDSWTLFPQNSAPFLKSVLDPRLSNKTASLICQKEEILPIAEHFSTSAEYAQRHFDLDSFLARGGCLRVFWALNPVDGARPSRESLGDITMATFFVPGRAYLFENHGGHFTRSGAFDRSMRELSLKLPDAALIPVNTKTNVVSDIYMQPTAFDYDNDGKSDILIATDLGSNILLHNEGDFSFSDQTKSAGVNYAASGMGVAVGDYNLDGKTDFFVTNTSQDYLYHNDSGSAFSNRTLSYATALDQGSIGWGTAFLDYDLDGWPDLAVGNGDFLLRAGAEGRYALFGDIAGGADAAYAPELTRPFFRVNGLFHNDGGTFANDSKNLCTGARSSKSLAVADFNNDGTPDIFIGNLLGGDQLMADTATGHYLKVKLVGTRSNRMGIGAVVSVASGAHLQTRQLIVGDSYHSQSSPTLLFGLSTSTTPVDVTVAWPSGARTTLKVVSPDQTITIRE